MRQPLPALRRAAAALLCVGSLLAALPLVAPGRAAAPAAPTAPRWGTDYDAARALSKKTGKRVLMEFYADWCGPCKHMEQTTLKDAQVMRMLDKFVIVRINIDKQPKLANKYEAESIPRAVVLAPSGKIVRVAAGYRDADAFILFLKQSL